MERFDRKTSKDLTIMARYDETLAKAISTNQNREMDTLFRNMHKSLRTPQGIESGKKVNHNELVRGIRTMITSEYEAVQLYTQLAEATDNELAKKVLLDISKEELVHAGEFLRLLKELSPEEETRYIEGAKEVEDLIRNNVAPKKQ